MQLLNQLELTPDRFIDQRISMTETIQMGRYLETDAFQTATGTESGDEVQNARRTQKYGIAIYTDGSYMGPFAGTSIAVCKIPNSDADFQMSKCAAATSSAVGSAPYQSELRSIELI